MVWQAGDIANEFGMLHCDIGSALAPEVLEHAPPPRATGEGLGALSRRLVQLMRDGTGRGPSAVRCHWAGPDVVLALFGDGFTRAEETLVRSGREAAALHYRGALQEALRDQMSSEVARSTGRGVTAVMSCARSDPDLIAEIFLLEPGEPGPAEAGPRGAGMMPAPRPGLSPIATG